MGLQCFLPPGRGVSAGGNMCVPPSPDPQQTRESQHTKKGSVFWVCQWYQHKILVVALYPSQPSREQMNNPEAGQSGTMAWDVAH